MIKQANENDIQAIEEILLDAVIWMKTNDFQNQWNEINIKWASLAKEYIISEFYIYNQNDVPAGCVAITDIDQKYWPEIPKGRSMYIHKLTIMREFAGQGISKDLIDFAKKITFEKGVDSLRLDCNLQNDKLRKLYEKEGFQYVGKMHTENGYDMALYVWQIVSKANNTNF